MRRFLFLTLLILAGCAQQEEQPAAPSLAPPAPETAPPTEPPKAVPPPPAKPAPRPVPKPIPNPAANPDELIGLDRDGVVKLLGEPEDSRAEGGARILSYHKSDCHLDLLLFFDVKTGSDRVLSYDFPPHRSKNCYADMRSGR